jgi:hypothetical protein
VSVGFRLWVFFGFFRLAVVSCWDCWVGSSWVLSFVFCWATYVYFLVYLEAHCAFFVIYIITYQKIYIFLFFSIGKLNIQLVGPGPMISPFTLLL